MNTSSSPEALRRGVRQRKTDNPHADRSRRSVPALLVPFPLLPRADSRGRQQRLPQPARATLVRRTAAGRLLKLLRQRSAVHAP